MWWGRLQQLIASNSPAVELAELMKLICKTFWSATYLEIPPLLLQPPVFTAWMECFEKLLVMPVPTVRNPNRNPSYPTLRQEGAVITRARAHCVLMERTGHMQKNSYTPLAYRDGLDPLPPVKPGWEYSTIAFKLQIMGDKTLYKGTLLLSQ